MRKIIMLLALMLVLSGCGAKPNEVDKSVNKSPVVDNENNNEEKVEDGEILLEEEATLVIAELNMDVVAERLATFIEIIVEGEIIPGVESTENFDAKTLLDARYSIAIGKEGNKVIVFDATIDNTPVAIFVALDGDNNLIWTEPYYTIKYAQVISDLENGVLDGLPDASFYGDSFDYWAINQ